MHKSKIKAMLKIKIDTGAQANVLSMRLYTRIFHYKEINESYSNGTHLIPYNGTHIPHYGMTNL